MKNLILFLSIFLFMFSCKESISPCENGRYDEGEIGIDCGGSCADCIFDKNDIADKQWIDLDTITFINEHFYGSDHIYFYNWATGGGIIGQLPSYTWSWINESDTLEFSYFDIHTSTFKDMKRKIIYINDGAYKYKTDLDNWEKIYPAILFD